MSEVVLERQEGEVWYISLNRPERKNALNQEVSRRLLEALDKAERAGAKVIVLRGEGGDFCAGGDLRELYESEDRASLMEASVGYLNMVLLKLRRTPAITVAVVEGYAVGAGLSLASACDLVIATEKALFNMGYRRIGLIPDGGGTAFLCKLLGFRNSNKLYLLSPTFDAKEAQAFGLVDFVFKEEELEEKLKELVGKLLSLPCEPVKYYKDLVNRWLFQGLEGQLEAEKSYVKELVKGPTVENRIKEVLGK